MGLQKTVPLSQKRKGREGETLKETRQKLLNAFTQFPLTKLADHYPQLRPPITTQFGLKRFLIAGTTVEARTIAQIRFWTTAESQLTIAKGDSN